MFMGLHDLLETVRKSMSPRRKKGGGRSRSRLGVEVLEDRTAPAVYKWTDASGKDNNWSTPANWNLNNGQVPGANDTAEFTAANSAPCKVDGADTVNQLIVDPGYTDKITITTTLTVTNGGSQASGTIDGGTLTIQASTATFDWSGGTRSGAAADKTVIQANATFRIVAPPDNAAPKVLDTATIQNSGTINWFNNNQDTVTLKNAAQIVNKPGSVFEDTSLQGNTHTIDTTDGTATQFSLQTDGVTPAQLTTILGPTLVFTTNFVNSGTVTTSGTLDLQKGTTSTGTFNVGNLKIKVNANTTNILNGASINTNNTNPSSTATLYADAGNVGALTISGTVNIGCFLEEVTSVQFPNTGDLTGSGTLNITGQFDWGDGTWSGSGSVVIAPNAKLHVNPIGNGTATVGGSWTLVNNGIMNWDSGTISIADTPSSSTFQNNGVMNVQFGILQDNAEAITVANNGTITTTGNLTFTNCGLDNYGTIQVNGGTLATDFALTQNLRTNQNAASLILGGGNVQTGTGLINTLGVISATAASSTITGDLTNSDYVKFGTPTSVATINVTGNFTQTGTGVLFMKVGRNNVGTQSDVLNITGVANLGGILQLSQLGNNLNVGDSVAVLKYGSQTGKFGSANVPNGSGWQTNAQATEFDVNQPAMTSLLDQSDYNANGDALASQVFTDQPQYTSYTFTPVSVAAGGFNITQVSTWIAELDGQVGFTTAEVVVYSANPNGGPNTSAPAVFDETVTVSSVTDDGSYMPAYGGLGEIYQVTLSGLNINLSQGNYYLAIAPVQNFSEYGQTFVLPTLSTYTQNAWFYNPNGGFLYGTLPVTDSTVTGLPNQDYAYQILGYPL